MPKNVTAKKPTAKKAEEVKKTEEKSVVAKKTVAAAPKMKVETFGDQELFKLISQTGDEKTEAMDIKGVGCLVKCTNGESGSLVFVQSAKIVEEIKDGKVVSRSLVRGV